MIIGVDGNEANVKERVGVSNYTLNILRYFKKKADKQTQFIVFLKNNPLADLPKENKFFKYEVITGNFLWSQIFLPIRLYLKKDIDVFFSPAHYLPRFCPYPSVVTIHDLSFLYYPQDFLKKDLFQLKNWTKYSVKKAKKIIAVSNTTKKDIVKSYQIAPEKIEVVYNGYEKNIKHKEPDFKIDNYSDPYILYVGTLQPRKNIITLIKAFDQFKKIYPKFKLIIAGKKGWLYKKIFQMVSDLGLEKEVYFTDYVTDNQLLFLYQNAFCLVFPSFYEGFGIPLLEAMSFGCPVISSFASSLPEIGADACLYFDPNNHYDLLEKLKTLKENSSLRKELINKGKKRVKEFSWKNCGEKTLEIIKSCV
ncbi:MAG: glycosyltransferase family 4 protein [Microgenomates group bacterium]